MAKYQISNSKYQKGFTLIELIVVLGIMSVVLGLVTVNIAGNRSSRNLKIAQNELVSNLRKIQSYTLSSREIIPNLSGEYYLIKFDLSAPRQYTIQAIYDTNSAPKLRDVETVNLPAGVNLVASSVTVKNRTNIPLTQIPTSCALIAFRAPFAKVHYNSVDLPSTCTPASPILTSTDKHMEILDFVKNTDSYPVSTDSTMVIRFSYTGSSETKSVLIKGVSGLICPTVDEVNCSF
jgi:prepilin-type N-terminal cleavage/methylation domain-containing protein